MWAVSYITNAIVSAGLELAFFHEFDALSDPIYPEMVQRADRLYTFGGTPAALPIIFSLRAHRKD